MSVLKEVIVTVVGVYALLFVFYPQNNPCDVRYPYSSCDKLKSKHHSSIDSCYASHDNGDDYCYTDPPWTQWLAYSLFTFSEIMNFFLSMVYHFNMWRPIRRAARFLDNMAPKFEESKWPSVDIFICHYAEKGDDTIETLTCAMAMVRQGAGAKAGARSARPTDRPNERTIVRPTDQHLPS